MRYAAFVRAINLGRRNQIAATRLRAVFADAGCEHVTTFLQTGNVLFELAARSLERATREIEGSLEEILGVETPVMMRKAKDLEALVTETPFGPETLGLDELWYVTFLRSEPKKPFPMPHEQDGLVIRRRRELDVFSVATKKGGRTVAPNALLERRLAVPATTRNWNTVVRLLAR